MHFQEPHQIFVQSSLKWVNVDISQEICTQIISSFAEHSNKDIQAKFVLLLNIKRPSATGIIAQCLDHTYSVFLLNGTQQNVDICATKVQRSPSATISVKPSMYTIFMHTFDKSNEFATQIALQLPLPCNAVGQMQCSIEHFKVLLVCQNAMSV